MSSSLIGWLIILDGMGVTTFFSNADGHSFDVDSLGCWACKDHLLEKGDLSWHFQWVLDRKTYKNHWNFPDFMVDQHFSYQSKHELEELTPH